MNNTNNVRRMVETALMAAVAVVLIFAAANPLLSFLALFSAVPIMVLTARQGIGAGLSGAVVMGLLLGILLDPISAVSSFVMFGLSAVAAGYMLRSKLSGTQTILVSALFFAIGFGALIIGSIQLAGVDPFAAIDTSFEEMKTLSAEQAKVFKLSQDDVNAQMKLYDQLQEMVHLTKPSMIILVGGFLALSNYFMARTIAKRSGVDIKDMTKFRDHRLPSSLVPGLVLIMVMTFIADQLNYVDQSVIYLNLQMIFIWIFFIQGISLLTYTVHQAGGNKARRAVIYIVGGIVMLPFGGMTLIAGLGLMDSVIDIRRLYENRKA